MDAVTVTANSRSDMERLLTCAPLRESFERLIVVDNASDDGSAELARASGAEVVPIKSRVGYARCVNAGVTHATTERFAVLNPDILFEHSGVMPRLERHLDRPGVAVAAPGLVLPDGRLQDGARHVPTPLDLVLRRRMSRERGAIHGTGEVPWVVGACFVARRDAWDAVGGLDERYFLYFEDVDFCWRLREAGWSVMLDEDVRVLHRHDAASRKTLIGFAMRQHVMSATRFYWRNPRFLVPGLPSLRSERLTPVSAPRR